MTGPESGTGTQSCPSCGTDPSPRAEVAETDEQVTHCEWCGAEYPHPEHGTPTQEPGQD